MITAADVQGHWKRHWIKAPTFEDHTTRVHWMQAGSLYADVRIPLERPSLTAKSCLADLDARELLGFARAEGFAGHITLQGSQCTWHREVNWHGTPDTLDVGDISFDAEGRMIEAGVLADYTELWEQIKEEDTKAFRINGEGYAGYLVRDAKHFVLGIGKPNKPSSSDTLRMLEQGQIPPDISGFCDGLHAVGRVDGSDLVAELATNPFCEGTKVAILGSDHVSWHCVQFDGTKQNLVLGIAEAQP